MQSGNIKMFMSKLSVISHQPSVRNIPSRVECLMSRVTNLNQRGVGLLAVIGIVSVIIIGAVVLTTPQIRQIVLPTPKPSPAASLAPNERYSDKQQLYLRNKATIMKNLNLNEEQFNLLVESANKD